jgi:hypothetical protein
LLCLQHYTCTDAVVFARGGRCARVINGDFARVEAANSAFAAASAARQRW